MAGERFPLADMISVLESQLREAARRSVDAGDGVALRVKECTVELGMSWERMGDGGIQLWIVKLGAGVDKTNTETITVTLEPSGTG